MLQRIQEASVFISSRTASKAKTAVILGTGLNGFADHMSVNCRIPYAEIPHFPVSTVIGHAGNLLFGTLDGIELMVMQGRFHYYEGYSMQQLTFPIRVMRALGIENIVLSNASGGVNPSFRVGDIMLIRDHINFFPDHPLRGKNEESLGPRFPNMSEVYDHELLERAARAAEKHGIRHHKGVYIGVQGPSLETPAEYMMYRSFGADCVGMSTVPEAIVAHHGGMKCLGISVITNVFRPDTCNNDSHDEILKAGAKVEEKLIAMVKEIVNPQ